MKLDLVTFTGADDSVSPVDLSLISDAYPFIEWGILFSSRSVGNPRFPSYMWLGGLVAQKLKNPAMKLSAHIYGYWVKQALKGDPEFIIKLVQYLIYFDRVQINFHAEEFNPDYWPFCKVINMLPGNIKQVILQLDGVNDWRLEMMKEHVDRSLVGLYDKSHGAGDLPSSWPKRILNSLEKQQPQYVGYAGGLGPDNIGKQLCEINEAADGDNYPYWIDMETKVRIVDTRGDRFDLEAVHDVIETVKETGFLNG